MESYADTANYYTPPTRDDAASLQNSGNHLIELLRDMGSSRELSLAITKAEEAVMWAKAHIERNPA